MTSLAIIQSARNPELVKLPQETITEMISKILAAPKIPGTIISVNQGDELKCHQLYIEFYLNENNLREALDSAKSALEIISTR